MSEALESLRQVGAEKIREATHIPIQHIRAILNEDFSSFSKIQFGGFISILEREYKLDLSDLKESAKNYFDAQKSVKLEAGLFVPPENNNKQKLFFGVITFVVILFIFIYKVSNSDSPVESVVVDNSVIESVIEEINTTQESNSSSVNEENSSTPLDDTTTPKLEEEEQNFEPVVEEVVEKSFTIQPKSKVWFGYIDADTHRHYQKTFSDAFELDPNKRWLLLFGHGYIDMSVNGELQKFPRTKLRFYYHDGELKAVTLDEFKKLNRGRKW